jgi:hypothetical protein
MMVMPSPDALSSKIDRTIAARSLLITSKLFLSSDNFNHAGAIAVMGRSLAFARLSAHLLFRRSDFL